MGSQPDPSHQMRGRECIIKTSDKTKESLNETFLHILFTLSVQNFTNFTLGNNFQKKNNNLNRCINYITVEIKLDFRFFDIRINNSYMEKLKLRTIHLGRVASQR